MLSKVTSGALMGIDALPVTVQVKTGESGEPEGYWDMYTILYK
jgi:hypothetical protein